LLQGIRVALAIFPKIGNISTQRGEPVVVFIHILMEQQISAPSGSACSLCRANSIHHVSSLWRREYSLWRKRVLAFLFRWNRRSAEVQSAPSPSFRTVVPASNRRLGAGRGNLLHCDVVGLAAR